MSGYSSLFSWAFDELFPLVSGAQRTAMLRQAVKLAAPPAQREVECGFELHHDGTGRVDAGFHCPSHLVEASQVALPSWWSRLVETSEPPRAAELFGMPSELERPSGAPALCRYRGRHWLEFDDAQEGQLRLAGVFQHCDTADRKSPRAFAELLEHFAAVGCFAGHDVRHSRALHRFFDAFGVPFQWGVMVGRAEGLKVVAMLDAAGLSALPAFLSEAGVAPLPELAEPLQLAVSLDVDLTRDAFGPKVGFELTGGDRTEPLSAWAGLDALLDAVGVPSEQSEAARRVLAPLPRGRRERKSWPGLESFLPPELSTVTQLATLNHLKLVCRQGGASLKSYVSLRELKGGLALRNAGAPSSSSSSLSV